MKRNDGAEVILSSTNQNRAQARNRKTYPNRSRTNPKPHRAPKEQSGEIFVEFPHRGPHGLSYCRPDNTLYPNYLRDKKTAEHEEHRTGRKTKENRIQFHG